MEKRSELETPQETLRRKIIGLGDRSIRKSYYPQLQKQLLELEEHKRRLEEQSEALLGTLEELERSRKIAQENEKKFRTLFENVIDGVLLVDSGSKRVSMGNKMLCRMCGYSEEELTDLPVETLLSEKDRQVILDSLETQFPHHGHLLTNIQVKRKDQSLFYADINASSICLNETPFWVGVFRDVSERKHAEEEIRQLNTELERRVEERTAELKTVNRELREFASVVSHDLKAPLRGIKQLASWLVEDYAERFDPEGQTMIELLMSQVQHMDTLIDGILKYSRAGRVLGVEEEVDLTLLLDTIQDAIAPPDSMTITLKQPLPVVFVDRMRLTQIFQNLLENAIKFMDKPEGHITVSCLDRGQYWQLCVADNGPGIDPGEQERIFRIFQRIGHHDEKEGAGIGLALVKKILEAGGEKIWLEANPGEGCQFYFTLKKEKVKDEES